jgi:hypothetical protein
MLKEMFTFLDDLREEGSINMFGAPSVLQKEFDLTKAEAFEVFTAWTEQFLQ